MPQARLPVPPDMTAIQQSHSQTHNQLLHNDSSKLGGQHIYGGIWLWAKILAPYKHPESIRLGACNTAARNLAKNPTVCRWLDCHSSYQPSSPCHQSCKPDKALVRTSKVSPVVLSCAHSRWVEQGFPSRKDTKVTNMEPAFTSDGARATFVDFQESWT